MRSLKDLGLIKRANSASKLFEYVVPDFSKFSYAKPNEYVAKIWNEYASKRKNSNLNGVFFEILIATLFFRENLTPLHVQAKLAFVPNAIYDLMLITTNNIPVGISLKTSLRERYKQADLEAIVLKNVHRKARNYLITMDSREAHRLKRKIKDGDVAGLDDVIVASDDELNTLITRLKKDKYKEAATIEIISARNVAK